jgi:VanZ family protein
MAFMIAYPAHRVAIALLMMASAIALEVAQNFIPGRHGFAEDAVVKLLGIGLALCVTIVARSAFRKRDAGGSE